MIFEKVSELAKKKGISISKLEKLAGLSKCSISKWKTASPTVNSLQAVAKVLETTVDELLK